MTLMKHLVRFSARTNGLPPEGIYSLLTTVYESLNIRKPDFVDHPSMTQPAGVESPDEVDLFVSVYADEGDDDGAVAAVQAVQTALRNFGIETVGAPQVRSSRPIQAVNITAAGVTYIEETRALTIDTWGPDWTDLELNLHSDRDGRTVVVLTDHEHGLARQQVAVVKSIEIRRPGGRPPEIKPGLHDGPS